MLSTHPEVWITNVLTSSSNGTWLSMLASGLQTVIELSFRDKPVRLHSHLSIFSRARHVHSRKHRCTPSGRPKTLSPWNLLSANLPAFLWLFCLLLQFFFSFSACNIYPRHRSSLHTQGDASFCYPIPVFSVRCAWLIFLARSKSHP